MIAFYFFHFLLLAAQGAIGELIAPKLGFITGENDTQLPIYKSFLTAASVLYDAVYVPGGTNSIATLEAEPDAVHFLNEAFKHCKAIAADRPALQVLKATYFGRKLPEDESEQTAMMEGVIITDDINTLAKRFITAIAQHRFLGT
jgi:catalase